MKTNILAIATAFFAFGFNNPSEKETTGKTYYYYLEVVGNQNDDYSYDVIFSEVKSAGCDWENTSKYGYPADAFRHIATAFDEWFQARYSNPYNYQSGYEAFGNRKLYTSRAEAESARNKALAGYRNSNIKYNIEYDNRFNYICR